MRTRAWRSRARSCRLQQVFFRARAEGVPPRHVPIVQCRLPIVTEGGGRASGNSLRASSTDRLCLTRRLNTNTTQIDMEAWRAQAARTEAESRTRAEEDVARERSSLKETRSALEAERGELLRRVARSEAAGRAAAAEVGWVAFVSFSCSPRWFVSRHATQELVHCMRRRRL